MALPIPLFVPPAPVATPLVPVPAPPKPRPPRPAAPKPRLATVTYLRSSQVEFPDDGDLVHRIRQALPSAHAEQHDRVSERARHVRHRRARFLAEPMTDDFVGVPVRNREFVERTAARSAHRVVAYGGYPQERRLEAATAALAARTGARQGDVRDGYLAAAERRVDRVRFRG